MHSLWMHEWAAVIKFECSIEFIRNCYCPLMFSMPPWRLGLVFLALHKLYQCWGLFCILPICIAFQSKFMFSSQSLPQSEGQLPFTTINSKWEVWFPLDTLAKNCPLTGLLQPVWVFNMMWLPSRGTLLFVHSLSNYTNCISSVYFLCAHLCISQNTSSVLSTYT